MKKKFLFIGCVVFFIGCAINDPSIRAPVVDVNTRSSQTVSLPALPVLPSELATQSLHSSNSQKKNKHGHSKIQNISHPVIKVISKPDSTPKLQVSSKLPSKTLYKIKPELKAKPELKTKITAQRIPKVTPKIKAKAKVTPKVIYKAIPKLTPKKLKKFVPKAKPVLKSIDKPETPPLPNGQKWTAKEVLLVS
jgi:hypothetical protein